MHETSSSFRADLHCHSHFSDGSFSPEELMEEAKQKGLSALSITDHDTVAAYPAAYAAAKSRGILLGAGVEFSSIYEGISIHILGYAIDLSSPLLDAFCQRHLERRRKRCIAILQKLKQTGLALSLEEVERRAFPSQLLGRPHIAEEMVQKGYVSSIQEAFSKYLKEGSSCFELGDPIGVEETIALIHAVHGKAFLAHPHLIANRGALRRLLLLPFDGIECYYARSSLHANQRFIDMANQRKLLISGGSDFHGRIKPQLFLGSSFVDKTHFQAIFGDLF